MRAPDPDAARRHLAEIEAMARDARTADDMRVLITALQVLARQAPIVDRLLRGQA